MKKNGFTLLEVLLVIILISMLVLIGVVSMRQSATHALALKASAQMENWLQAAYTYYGYNGSWPTSFDQSEFTIYAPDVSKKNPWGYDYKIVSDSSANFFQIAADLPSKTQAEQVAGNLVAAKVAQSSTDDKLYTVTATVVKPSGKAISGTGSAFVAGGQLPSFQAQADTWPPGTAPYDVQLAFVFTGYPMAYNGQYPLYKKYKVEVPNCNYFHKEPSDPYYLPVLLINPGSLTWSELAPLVTVEKQVYGVPPTKVSAAWVFDMEKLIQKLEEKKLSKLFPFIITRCIRSDFQKDKIFTVPGKDGKLIPNPFVLPMVNPSRQQTGCAAGWDPGAFSPTSGNVNGYLDMGKNNGICEHKCETGGYQGIHNVICMVPGWGSDQ